MNNSTHESETSLSDDTAATSGTSEDAGNDSSSSAGRKRRIGVPSIYSFRESIEKSIDVCQTVGPEGSQAAMAIRLGTKYTSSKFALILSALRRHNLFTATDRAYVATDILRPLLFPDSPQILMQARATAFLEDKLMRAVWEKMRGEVIPEDPTFIKNIMLKYGIEKDFVDAWYTYFIEGGTYAGIFHEFASGKFQVVRDIVNLPSASTGTTPKASEENGADIPPSREEKPPEHQHQQPPLARTDLPTDLDKAIRQSYDGNIIRRKLSGGRLAFVLIPDELSSKDIESLKLLLQSVGESLEAYKVDGQ